MVRTWKVKFPYFSTHLSTHVCSLARLEVDSIRMFLSSPLFVVMSRLNSSGTKTGIDRSWCAIVVEREPEMRRSALSLDVGGCEWSSLSLSPDIVESRTKY